MGYFPMCVDLRGKPVLLVGSGAQIQEKAERLAPFGAVLIRLDALTEADLTPPPAFVVAGDLPEPEAERTAALCRAHGVAINVVDLPRLCTFTFPSLLVQGDVTVSVSTAGKSPAAAAWIRQRIAQALPQRTEAILDWLAEIREQLRATHGPADRARLMRTLTAAAFTRGDVLPPEEYQRIVSGDSPE